jgi:WD40 repeat protein
MIQMSAFATLFIILVISIGKPILSSDSKSYLFSCDNPDCFYAISKCVNSIRFSCFGPNCKECVQSYSSCNQNCTNDLFYNIEHLKSQQVADYQTCDPNNFIQASACNLYCRSNNYHESDCVYKQQSAICKCSNKISNYPKHKEKATNKSIELDYRSTRITKKFSIRLVHQINETECAASDFKLLANSNQIVSNCYSNGIMIFDSFNLTLVRKISFFNGVVFSTLALLNNQNIAAGAEEITEQPGYTIRIYDTHDGSLIRILYGHRRAITSLNNLSMNELVSTSEDCTIRLWNIDDGTIISQIDEKFEIYSSIVFTSVDEDSKFKIAYSGWSGLIHIRNIRDGQRYYSIWWLRWFCKRLEYDQLSFIGVV